MHSATEKNRSSAARSARIIVAFRNDDPSALSDAAHERRLFEVFEHWGVPQTIGVVPNITRGDVRARGGGRAPLDSNPAMVELLVQHCAKAGSEIALHGFTHETNHFSIPSRKFYFEFARLPLAEQERLLREGVQMIEETTGVRPRTFIPPWNRLDANTVTACENTGFKVLSTHMYVPAEKIIPFGANSTVAEFHQHLEAARRSEQRVFICTLLHTPSMNGREDQKGLDTLLAAVRAEPECEPMTILAAAERYADELRDYNRAGRSIIEFYEEMDSPRARAHVYARGLCASRMARLQGPAVALYRAGDYAACATLDKRIERWSASVLLGARLFALVVAAGLASLVAIGTRSQARPEFIAAGGLLALWVAMAFAIWRATSPDTRRELASLGLTASFGWIFGSLV